MRLPFDRFLFIKVLAVVLTIICLGLVAAFWLQGNVASRDIVGSLISGVIGAYLVHLWLLPGNDESPED